MKDSALAKEIVTQHLTRLREKESGKTGQERRLHPRIKMSIPAVSLVNFIDNETCSYPVEVLDISKRGVRIQFKHPAPLMREKIAKATGFEVVFAVPDSSLTVALRCTPKRFAAGERTWLAGVFRKECEPVLSMMSKCFEGKGGEAPVVT